MITRRHVAVIAAASAFAPVLVGRAAFAQPWPRRFVRFVVPFPAGVAPDVGCRVLTARLSEMWGQQAVVENKPGAGGNVGTESVARAAPDGYTVLMAAFTVQSVADFISYAKANHGKISYASAGHGTSPHLCGELFKRMAGIEMTHVPYRTGAQQDLVAGHIDVMFAVAPFELLRASQARGLAVTTAKPSGCRQHRKCRRWRNPACLASTSRHGGASSCPPKLRLP
jgi:tripartite-type tricarboxylate transporter receptor subunit TctC